jgi:hypothetical protein
MKFSGRIQKGKIYAIPGYTRTIEKTSWGAFLVRDADGSEVGRRSTRDAALRLITEGPRSNPTTHYTQPDLFGGESSAPVFTPLEELTDAEIRTLPRKAFSDDEWDEIGMANRYHVMLGEIERGASYEDFSSEDWKELPLKYRAIVLRNDAEKEELAEGQGSDLFDDDLEEKLDAMVGPQQAAYLTRLIKEKEITRSEIPDDFYDNYFKDTAAEDALYEEGTPDGDRVLSVAKALQDAYEHATSLEGRQGMNDEETIEYEIHNTTERSLARNADAAEELERLRGDIEDDYDYEEDEVYSAIMEAIQEPSNWRIELKECDPYRRTADDVYSYSVRGDIWLGNDPALLVESLDDLSRRFEDSDMDQIWNNLSDDWVYNKKEVQLFLNREKNQWGRKVEIQRDGLDTSVCVVANPNWDAIRRAVGDALDIDLDFDEIEADRTGGEPDFESKEVDESQRISVGGEFDGEGWRLYELEVENLPPEGDRKTGLNHCIGDPKQGYIRRLQNGTARAFSVRLPNGKRVVSIFAQTVPGTNQIMAIEQIKGNSNRLPGTTSYNGDRPHNKRKNTEEVKRIIDVLHYLGINPYTVKDLHPPSDPHAVLGHPEIQEYLEGYGFAPPKGGGRYGWEKNPAEWPVPAGPRLDFGFHQ